LLFQPLHFWFLLARKIL